MAGFIHDKLDIKLLVLYIMDHLSAPIDFDTLTDLAMCDSGVDYFQFAEAVSELTGSGHLEQQEDVYAVTDRGRRAGAAGESSLSPVIRQRCDRRLAPLNQALKRKAQVRAQVEEQPLGFQVSLSMDDDQGSLFSLTLLAPTQADAQRLAQRYLAHPDRMYNALLGVLLADGEEAEHN
ncbi:MAG: DUF4364 family protein [Oscillospiraceae bacterium]|nr:DUF4364 family protein [Oscillospiraceae bacterium]